MEGYIQSLFLLLSAMNVLVSFQDDQSVMCSTAMGCEGMTLCMHGDEQLLLGLLLLLCLCLDIDLQVSKHDVCI